MNLDHILTLLVVIPLAGLVPLLFFIRDDRAVKQVAIVTTFAELVLSIVMLSQFHIGEPGFQLHEKVPWIPGLGVSYELGVDGLSVLLVPMTTLLTFISVLYSSGGAIKTRMIRAASGVLRFAAGCGRCTGSLPVCWRCSNPGLSSR